MRITLKIALQSSNSGGKKFNYMAKICETKRQDGIRYDVRIKRRASYNDNGQPYFIEDTIGNQLAPITAMVSEIQFSSYFGTNKLVWGIKTAEYPNGLWIYTDGQHIWEGSVPVVVSILRSDGLPDAPICRCDDFSCRVDCAIAPDGFCCIDHAVTNRLLQILQN